jgi:ABC-type uncharacterized transport system permease subunit
MTVVIGTGAVTLPSAGLIPLIMIAAMLTGALALLGPAVLKTKFGVDEVVTTLLLNFIVILFVSMLLEGPLKDPMGLGWPQSRRVIEEAQLPRLIKGKRLHFGFILAIDLGDCGLGDHEEDHARLRDARRRDTMPKPRGFAGIPVNRVIVKTALLSGGLAALAGFSEVAGLKGNLTLDLSPGYGYTGIVVAMLAMLNPLGVIAAAIFVAGIFVGADAMSRSANVPSYIADRDGGDLAADNGRGDHADALPRALEGEDDRSHSISCSRPASGSAAIRIASPLIFATMGELICERAGVLNLGIEGIMVAGAFAGWFTVYMGGDLWTGVLVAMR